jgi:tRNA-splicing ligase RtcB (3'-phosphate/5'-hydroxy nucleic acid ligase)
MTSSTITGKTLTEMGYTPGVWFKAAIAAAETVRQSGADDAAIRAAIDAHLPDPVLPLRAKGEIAYHLNIRAESPDEAISIGQVEAHMAELMRIPTVRGGAVMPDACVSGFAPGSIPVGGVIAAENAIHPGMHSADICCSMAVTMFDGDVDPTAILDAGMRLSHFGGGGRQDGTIVPPPAAIIERFAANAFLRQAVAAGAQHFATQGDGNHFYYVGRVASSGQIALVTHHGSRRPGALLYKGGMAAAEKATRKVSPATPAHNAWLAADSDDGRAYWQALQIIRDWTKASHYAIHDLVAHALGMARHDRFWNEHNFVFQRDDGLFYHGKGATPAWGNYASDTNGLTLIPLNMAEPVLIARGRDASNGLGFAPHGAGRNLSRTAYMKRHIGKTQAQMIAEQTQGIDARFFCGIPDVSELPGAYKSAATVRSQIQEYGLADIVDTIEPIGCIMAGDWQQDAPWRRQAAKPAR